MQLKKKQTKYLHPFRCENCKFCVRNSSNSRFRVIIRFIQLQSKDSLDSPGWIFDPSPKPSSPSGYVVPRRTWMQRRVSQSDVQFLLIEPLKSGRMCLRLQPLLLHYFKCQESCDTCICMYVCVRVCMYLNVSSQEKNRDSILNRRRPPSSLSRIERERVILSLSKGHSAPGGRSPFDSYRLAKTLLHATKKLNLEERME